LEAEGKDLGAKVKEASALAKTIGTICGDMKKKVDAHKKKLARL
jgi:hypothetical protein